MNESTELRLMIDSQSTNIELNQQPENQMEAYLLAYRIQEGQKFLEYFNESSAKSPQTVVLDYMRSIDAPTISTVSAISIKEVLFEDLHHNYHKTALLKGVSQAYFDVCLFLGIAGICTGKRDLNYVEAIANVHQSLDSLESGYNRTCDLLSAMKWSGKLQDLEQVSTGVIDFSSLRNSFNQSVAIVDLYLKNRIKYNQSYGSIVSALKDLTKQSEDEIFFSNVVTVLRNKDSFTDKQISHVNDVYMNRFTEEQQEYYKVNIPTQTPSIADTQAFFFKTKNTEESIFNIL